MKLSYIKHNDIDKRKWDDCLSASPNDLIYAHSFYLDIMSPGWHALVMNDYESVMPLTWRKKAGIKYLYQPSFTQQLGVFGSDAFNDESVKLFMTKAFSLFSFSEINLNFANKYEGADKQKMNFILDLNLPFTEIEKKFRKDIVKEIPKLKLLYLPSSDFNSAILLFQQLYAGKIFLSKTIYARLSLLCAAIHKRGELMVRKVAGENGDILSIAIIFVYNKRLYYILSATTFTGRNLKANYHLLYNLIKEFSGKHFILDFEGSDIPSIQFFYKKFGPAAQPYPFVRHNGLPFIHKKIKKFMDDLKMKR